MYRLIVAARIRGIFRRLNAGDAEAMIGSLAPRFTYRFYGDHALGGERTTRAAMRAWWGRVFRLLPGLRFEPRDVLVAGWPWSTRVAADVVVHVTLPDGTGYENVVNQFVKLSWGRVIEVRTLEDTQKLARALGGLAADGVEEAAAEPITDESAAEPGSRQKKAP
jgi:ketosteroid isomerase-like protein